MVRFVRGEVNEVMADSDMAKGLDWVAMCAVGCVQGGFDQTNRHQFQRGLFEYDNF